MLTLFKTSQCAYCHQVEKLLRAKGADFIMVNLDDDFEGRLALQKKTGATTVPILMKDEEYVIGWNPAKIMQMIAL